MDVRRKFEIDIYKLSNTKHDYEFEINDKFFESFEDSIIQKGDLNVNLSLDKSETMLEAEFVIKGTIELVCDRSLDEFDYPVDIKKELIFKYGSEYSEVSDEIIIIPKDAQKLDVSQYIYEFIGLSVPMKKLHPRYKDEESEEEGKLIYTTKGESAEESSEETENPDQDIWEKLKNLKNNN